LRAAAALSAPTQAPPPAGGVPELRVGGVTPFTSIDFPGQLAAVVFVQGCPWRCGYCHNPHLQSRQAADGSEPVRWPDLVHWLGGRVGLLDAVVFSGGEPTMDPGLESAMAQARGLGLLVGLHTAGIYPRRLQAVLPLVDWVGVDVKAPLADHALHERVTGVADSARPVLESVRMVLASGVAHEFRTTAQPDLLNEADLLRIGDDLSQLGARSFALQIARPVGSAAAAVAVDYPSAAVLERLGALFPHFVLRRG